MNCKYDKCVLSTASLARIFKQKVTLLSRVFDQDVFVQLAMMQCRLSDAWAIAGRGV